MLALVGIGPGDDGDHAVFAVLRECSGQCTLHGGEADHFAADFCKTFGATEDGDVAILVHGHDVASVVPAVKFLEGFVGFRVEVTLHDVWAFHEQLAAFRHAIDFFYPVTDAREQPTHGAIPAFNHGIGTERRAGFGGAVSLGDTHTKFLGPNIPGRFLYFFRPTHEIAQAGKVRGLAKARVAIEKSVGRQQDGAFAIIEDRRNVSVHQRRGE